MGKLLNSTQIGWLCLKKKLKRLNILKCTLFTVLNILLELNVLLENSRNIYIFNCFFNT